MCTVHTHILINMHLLHKQLWRSDTEAGGLVGHAADGCNHSILWLLSRGRWAWASPLRPRARPRRPRRSPRPPTLAASVAVPVQRSAPELKGLKPAPEVRRNRWRLESGWLRAAAARRWKLSRERDRAACKGAAGRRQAGVWETLQEAWLGY